MGDSETDNAEMGAAMEVHLDVGEGPGESVNGNPPRMDLFQAGFLAIAVSVALIYLLIKPLSGLYDFVIYSILFMGLLLLLAATFPSSISATTAKRMIFIVKFLIYVGLALKMKLSVSS